MRMVGKSLLVALALLAAPSAHADGDMQPIGRFAIDRTEVSVGAFRRFVAATGMVTMAERQGGGSVFEAGWRNGGAGMPGCYAAQQRQGRE